MQLLRWSSANHPPSWPVSEPDLSELQRYLDQAGTAPGHAAQKVSAVTAEGQP